MIYNMIIELILNFFVTYSKISLCFSKYYHNDKLFLIINLSNAISQYFNILLYFISFEVFVIFLSTIVFNIREKILQI